MDLIDRLIQISDVYNPYTYKLADNDNNDVTWLYKAVSLPLKEELDKARTPQERQYVQAIVDYMWTPLCPAD